MTDQFEYNALDGSLVQGVVWSPGPLPKTVWVLPEEGAREGVVVRLSEQPDSPHREIEWDFDEYVVKRCGSLAKNSHYRESYVQITRIAMGHAPALSPKLWKVAAASLMIGYDIESPDGPGR